jgi:hypothetical protein
MLRHNLPKDFPPVTAKKLNVPLTERFAFSLNEAAAYYGRSPNHHLKLVANGVMPEPRYLDGSPYWLRTEIESFLKYGGMPLLPTQAQATLVAAVEPSETKSEADLLRERIDSERKAKKNAEKTSTR